MTLPVRLSNSFSYAAPSLAVANNSIHLAWMGVGVPNNIWWSTTSFAAPGEWVTATWSTPSLINLPEFATDHAPSLASDNAGSALTWMVWRRSSDGSIWWSTYAGAWSPAEQIPGAFTGAAPTIAYYKGEIIVAWRGLGADQEIHWATYSRFGFIEPFKWSTPAVAPGVGGTNDAPALAAANDGLYTRVRTHKVVGMMSGL